MVEIASPQKKSIFGNEDFFKKISFILVAAFLVSVLLNFFLLLGIKKELKTVQASQREYAEKFNRSEEQIKKSFGKSEESLRRVKELETNFFEFKKKSDKDFERVKKENKILLMNNQDFIKMFEAMNSDLESLRKKGVVISYKADAGDMA